MRNQLVRSEEQPKDEITEKGEARNDFWSIEGNYIYRHHVEPRVQLYAPTENIVMWVIWLSIAGFFQDSDFAGDFDG